MIEIGCHYTGAVFLVQIRKLLTLVSIVGIIDIPISALNWTQKLRKKICGVMAKFWQFSSGLILQNKTWINECSFESESWQVIYNRDENKNMSGSADALKNRGFQHCSSSLIYRSRVAKGITSWDMHCDFICENWSSKIWFWQGWSIGILNRIKRNQASSWTPNP